MSGDRLYDRVARLTVSRPSGFFSQEPNAVVIEDLQIEFSIVKDLTSTPNSAEVKVYNLAERTRTEFTKRPLHVLLEAGYDGRLQRILQGDAIHTPSAHTGVEWCTTIEVKDGGRAHAHARVSKSYKPGARVADVIRDTVESMGLTLSSAASGAAALQQRFASGVAVHGPAAAELDRLMRSRGVGWSIQDGRMQVLEADGGFLPGEAPVIEEDAGMIGEPAVNLPKKSGDPPTWIVKSQLYPGILPGGRVVVRSRLVGGTFKVLRVAHTGQVPEGADWTTELELKPL